MKDRDPKLSEREFLDRYDPAEFERPSTTVDLVLLTQVDDTLRVLTRRRTEHPHRLRLSLPGGFVGMTESLDRAAARVLTEKTGFKNVFLEQLYTFGAPKRDPRGRIITVAYYALADWDHLQQAWNHHGELAVIDVPWQGETGGAINLLIDDEPQDIAFDHADIIGMAVKRLRGKLDYAPIGFQLLPERFTLLRLQQVHETVLGHTLNKDSFRRRMLASGMLEATGERQQSVGRPAELYRFVRRSANSSSLCANRSRRSRLAQSSPKGF